MMLYSKIAVDDNMELLFWNDATRNFGAISKPHSYNLTLCSAGIGIFLKPLFVNDHYAAAEFLKEGLY